MAITNSRWGAPSQARWDSLANAKGADGYFKWNGYDANFPGTRTEQYMASKNWLGLSKQDNPFSKGNIKGTMGGLMGGLGSTIGGFAGDAIRGGFDDEGVGSGIQNVGGKVGDALSTVNPIVGGIVSIGSGLIGGLVSRAFGAKENKVNTGFIKDNTNKATSMGNILAGSSDNMNLVTNASKMVGGSGFNWRNLYENGWFTSKGTRLGNNLIAKENTGLAIQSHGLSTGANNIDRNMDRNTLKNFSAYGGPIYGPIEYAFLNEEQAKDNFKPNGIMGTMAGISPQLYSFGGNLMSNGGIWSDGVTHINTGGSHEENPEDGVQIGVDSQNDPNLVEENEVIYNNYVFSARLTVPKQKINKKEKPTQEQKVLKKYEGMSYADAAKKAEHNTGVDERPNDTIAKRGFEAELEILARSQEQEREIQNLKEQEEAIKNMTPEEFAALQQQQEQQAQQQALEEQAAMEQQAAMQQGQPIEQQVSPEELAAMQQQEQMMQQVPQVQQAQTMGALGGNLHADGGELQEAALEEPQTEIPANEDVPQEQQEIPVEEMSTSQLNSAIDEIYTWAKQNGNRQLAKNARKAKKASREDKEDFVDDAQEEIREAEENRRIAEQQEQERQLQEQQAAQAEMQAQQEAELQAQQQAAQEQLQQQAATQQMQEQQTPQEQIPQEEQNNQFGRGGVVTFDDWWKENVLKGGKEEDLDYPALYEEYLGEPLPIGNSYSPGQIKGAIREWYNDGNYYNNRIHTDLSAVTIKPSAKTTKDSEDLSPIIETDIVKANNQIYGQPQQPIGIEPDYIKRERERNAQYIGLPQFEGINPSKDINPFTIANPTVIQNQNITPTKKDIIKNIKDKDKNEKDPFPRRSNMPLYIGLGAQLGALAHNFLTPVDYSNADILKETADRAKQWLPVTFTPIGGELSYVPSDRNLPRINLAQALGAGLKTVTNTINPAKHATALTMLNNYNNALGPQEKQLLDADINRLSYIAEHNKDIAKTNSTGAMQANAENQQAYARAGMAYSEMKAKEAAIREDLERQKAAAIAQNLSAIPNLILTAYENKHRSDVQDWGMRNNIWGSMPTNNAKGGKLRIRRRKGLSF